MNRPDTDSKKEIISYVVECITKQVVQENDSYGDHFQIHTHELKQACDIIKLAVDEYLLGIREIELE